VGIGKVYRARKYLLFWEKFLNIVEDLWHIIKLINIQDDFESCADILNNGGTPQ
jgi:hypothetical protein